ncbi:hypothetical protein [Pseudophaeobacter sp.]|uniref:hypothetical protein n=1 Tax=Pseudophaeobacter sp. TaxID=1971739 RepID=UPI0026326FD0|nr:hypothetical protein [Pseudophaeobacter sp.]
MPTTPFETSEAWTTENRFTAADETDALLSNTGSGIVYFEVTKTDDLPSVHPRKATPLHPGQSIPLQLKVGWRLWLSGEGGLASLLVAP